MSTTRTSQGWARHVFAFVLLCVLAMLLSGCGGIDEAVETVSTGYNVGSDTIEMDMAEESATDRMIAPEAAMDSELGYGDDVAANVSDADRLIIRDMAVRLEISDVEDTISEIRSLTAGVGGVVTDLQVSTDDWGPVYHYEGALSDGRALSAYLTVRVPVDKVEAFTQDVRDLGDVLRESEGESDVTQQHIDLSARLRNLQAQEEQLRSFFDRAEDVEGLLAVQRELERVRGEIESLQDRIGYLERQASMATVSVELVEPEPVVRPVGTDWGFADAVTTGIRALVGTINALIILLLGALPLILIGLVIFFVIRAIVRSRREARKNVSDEAAGPSEPM